jgi:hypothetical protein
MKTLTLIAFSAAFTSTCSAAVTKLSPEDRKALQRGRESVRMIRSTGEIAPAVTRACAAVILDHKFEMANPGKPFQVTDVISTPNLPWRRLIWVASIPGYDVVHYERGGIAHSFHILLVASGKAPRPARVIWSAVATGARAPLNAYDDFLDALKTGQLDDSVDYSR